MSNMPENVFLDEWLDHGGDVEYIRTDLVQQKLKDMRICINLLLKELEKSTDLDGDELYLMGARGLDKEDWE